LPLAAVACLPPSISENTIARRLNFSTIQTTDCGITLNDIVNATTISDLHTLAVLTSQPNLLSEDQVATATTVLANYLENSETEVSLEVNDLSLDVRIQICMGHTVIQVQTPIDNILFYRGIFS